MRNTLYRYFGFHGFFEHLVALIGSIFGCPWLVLLFPFWKSSTAQRMPFQMLIIQMLPPPSSLQSLSHFLPIESSPIILSVLIAFNHVHTFRKKRKKAKNKKFHPSSSNEQYIECNLKQTKNKKMNKFLPIALHWFISYLSCLKLKQTNSSIASYWSCITQKMDKHYFGN